MPIEYDKKSVRLVDSVSVEDAEGLLEWLQTRPRGKVNLAACSHMHTANFQVLVAAKPQIIAWPADPELTRWLKTALEVKPVLQQGE
jgi:hypothetical protein